MLDFDEDTGKRICSCRVTIVRTWSRWGVSCHWPETDVGNDALANWYQSLYHLQKWNAEERSKVKCGLHSGCADGRTHQIARSQSPAIDPGAGQREGIAGFGHKPAVKWNS
jgi:hypothetical protein